MKLPATDRATLTEAQPGDYIIVEHEDDMFVAQRHWHLGNVCIARRPKLLSNDQWRPIAQRIVAALSLAGEKP